MAGMRQKPPELLHFQRGGRGRGARAVQRPEGWKAPALPETVTAPLGDRLQARYQAEAVRHARAVWRAWWASAAAQAVDEGSDLEALRWWITCVFRRALYLRVVREQPLVKGSMGQPVVNPLEGVMGRLSAEIARTEAHFGMTTLDRFRLHIEAPRAAAAEESWRSSAAMAEYRRALLGEASTPAAGA